MEGVNFGVQAMDLLVLLLDDAVVIGLVVRRQHADEGADLEAAVLTQDSRIIPVHVPLEVHEAGAAVIVSIRRVTPPTDQARG